MQQPDEPIPEEILALAEELRAKRQEHAEAIGRCVAECRDEAVKGRKLSGIEEIWDEDEEYYQGIDAANRSTHHWLKSPTASGGLIGYKPPNPTKCTSFFNITRQFVESAAARMGDILLPAGDWNFTIKATPVQDDAPQSLSPAVMPMQGVQPMQPDMPPAQEGMPTDPNQPVPQVAPDTTVDPRQKDAEKRAEKAELWIQDKLTECSHHSEARKVIEDAAKLGVGILKGPFPDKIVSRKAVQGLNGYTLEVVEETSPVSRAVDPRDFFPDPSCGENIQNGSYVFERDRLTPKQLRALKDADGYLADSIDKVLDEGPSRKNYTEDGRRIAGADDDGTFEVFYFYGEIDVNDLGAVCVCNKESEKKMVPAIVTLINDTAIKAVVDPTDTGSFPYDVMPWQRVAGQWYGIGVSRQGRTAQAMLNSSARAMMDNMGLSSGPQIIIRDGCVYPADGEWTITPRKVWRTTETMDAKSLGDVFAAINIPTMQAELAAIIQLAYKMMEDATGIFFIMQGQQGSAPDTVGGMELMHRNASAILRRLARVFDERVTEPHIRRYYNWLLLHGPEDCKGDMKIEAIGSTALVEREIQAMDSMVLLQLSVNPIYGLDPAAAMGEVLKFKKYNPDKWQMSEEKKASIQPPMVPAIEIAKIRAAQEDKQLAQEKDIAIAAQTLTKHKIDVDQNREDIYAQGVTKRDEDTLTMKLQALQLEKELAILKYSTEQNISLDKVKAELAKTSMTLAVQKQLSGVTKEAEQVATPLAEPPGRAQDGHAFTE
jgi:hypothetical protein